MKRESMKNFKRHQLFYADRHLRLVNFCFLMGVLGLIVNANAKNLPAPAKPYQTFSQIVSAAPASQWRTPSLENIIYLELASGRVVIELAPQMAPNHVANISALIRERYFDGLAIVRSQDNYVAQWGEPVDAQAKEIKTAKKSLEAEYTVKNKNIAFDAIKDRDGYAPQSGFHNGFPAGRDLKSGEAWLAHCYGAVGVGRGNENNSGSGASLYAVTGHAPRHLDRNITVIGRVLQGMPLLSALPRGKGRLGFYEKPAEMTPIISVRLASEVAEAERTNIQVLHSNSPSFSNALEALRNRGGDWFKRPAGYVEICNVPLAIRVLP
jgi:cyclophilin family peptidyl-prolyl cis-trans isomerase